MYIWYIILPFNAKDPTISVCSA